MALLSGGRVRSDSANVMVARSTPGSKGEGYGIDRSHLKRSRAPNMTPRLGVW